MEIELTPVYPYSFKETVLSHGWVSLPSFFWDMQHEKLHRVELLKSGEVVKLHIGEIGNPPNQGKVKITVECIKELTPLDETEICNKVKCMLRLEEDLSEFYDLCLEYKEFHWVSERGAGRFLRSSNIFEDIIKIICTTNTNWSQTTAMVTRLVEKLGLAYAEDKSSQAFPTPEAIVQGGIDLLKDEIKLGYRSEFVFELSQNNHNDLEDLNKYQSHRIDSEVLRQRLMKLKGIGPYAASHLLVFLGYYDHLGVDTEMRSFVSQKYFNGQRVTDDEILKVYHKWGKWKYLVYWAERKRGLKNIE
ncbi:MAG: DNA-3-methyladenine glycosylase family protein [bacterium]